MVTLLRLNRCQYLLWKNREWGNVGRERERETEGHTQRDTDTEKDTEREGVYHAIHILQKQKLGMFPLPRSGYNYKRRSFF